MIDGVTSAGPSQLTPVADGAEVVGGQRESVVAGRQVGEREGPVPVGGGVGDGVTAPDGLDVHARQALLGGIDGTPRPPAPRVKSSHTTPRIPRAGAAVGSLARSASAGTFSGRIATMPMVATSPGRKVAVVRKPPSRARSAAGSDGRAPG